MLARYWTFWTLALGCVAFLGDPQGWLVEAGTISGTGVTLGGLDNFAETVETYLKGNVGKMIGMLIAVAGIAMVVAQKMALGLSGLGAGIAIAFVPNIIGTAFDTTAAATLIGAAAFVPWASGGSVLNSMAQVGFVLLWPVALALKYGRDPVVWLSLALVLALRPTGLYRLLRGQALKAVSCGLRARIAGAS
ncbi:MAG: hypothetical protein OXP66_00035 [Candidatus Tectomicrobia bacterium]|nr:hypothetical protein [Candidatus Tectomicrobia bacterium]